MLRLARRGEGRRGEERRGGRRVPVFMCVCVCVCVCVCGCVSGFCLLEGKARWESSGSHRVEGVCESYLLRCFVEACFVSSRASSLVLYVLEHHNIQCKKKKKKERSFMSHIIYAINPFRAGDS